MGKKTAFTILELVFVIVVMGILAKFGVGFLAEAYRNYMYQHINNDLQNKSAAAAEFIAKRLQYRIKDSVIIRDENNASNFEGLEESNNTSYNVLEWIGYDIDGFRGKGDAVALWSGIFDRKAFVNDRTQIQSPGSDFSAVDEYIDILSDGKAGIDDAAIYFLGSEFDITTNDFGWLGAAISDQNRTMHPVEQSAADVTVLKAKTGTGAFNNADKISPEENRYKVAWSAYAIRYDPGTNFDGTLTLYYNYRPWLGERYDDATTSKAVIMEHVSTFKRRQNDFVIKIKVCTKSALAQNVNAENVERYSICKEKTIY